MAPPMPVLPPLDSPVDPPLEHASSNDTVEKALSESQSMRLTRLRYEGGLVTGALSLRSSGLCLQ
jgi:hypothetical protein